MVVHVVVLRQEAAIILGVQTKVMLERVRIVVNVGIDVLLINV